MCSKAHRKPLLRLWFWHGLYDARVCKLIRRSSPSVFELSPFCGRPADGRARWPWSRNSQYLRRPRGWTRPAGGAARFVPRHGRDTSLVGLDDLHTFVYSSMQRETSQCYRMRHENTCYNQKCLCVCMVHIFWGVATFLYSLLTPPVFSFLFLFIFILFSRPYCESIHICCSMRSPSFLEFFYRLIHWCSLVWKHFFRKSIQNCVNFLCFPCFFVFVHTFYVYETMYMHANLLCKLSVLLASTCCNYFRFHFSVS